MFNLDALDSASGHPCRTQGVTCGGPYLDKLHDPALYMFATKETDTANSPFSSLKDLVSTNDELLECKIAILEGLKIRTGSASTDILILFTKVSDVEMANDAYRCS